MTYLQQPFIKVTYLVRYFVGFCLSNIFIGYDIKTFTACDGKLHFISCYN